MQESRQEEGRDFEIFPAMAVDEQEQDDPGPRQSKITAELIVNLEDPVLVYPKSSQSSHQVLYLSHLDRQAPLFMYSLYFYRAGGDSGVFNRLRDAMERNLVPHFPAAGRIRYGESGEPELHCGDQGVVLVEASTGARIDDFGDMRDANQEFEKFVYKIPPSSDTALIVAQVTRCGCGGFVIGFGSRHELFDGLSALHFLSDWAALARGGVEEIEPPCQDRQRLRPKIKAEEPDRAIDLSELYRERFQGIPLLRPGSASAAESIEEYLGARHKCRVRALSISDEMIQRLKARAMDRDEGSALSSCTTFEVLAAHAWLARIKALEIGDGERALLEFTVNTRPKIDLPHRFMGNAFIMAYSNAAAGDLLSAPFHAVVGAIQSAKASVTEDYIWGSIDALRAAHSAKGSSGLLPSFRQTTIVSDWTRFSFDQLDFGWGAAAFATPVAMLLPDVLFLLRDGMDKRRICLKLGLMPHTMEKFEKNFYDLGLS
ncbi:brassinosteroid-related acyltransferase 1 [Selaginella moellendorffii]|uniref:brassinosteroid-related acyltransferase 1 n=1 Tax=Selaginella moellendorffii TaxID=88036 RepID=UPI000D1CB343|nr:brassinosteroid-related acyltransferase 1 [Selaginella moellendorffii]|eukprot:XP_024544165.1 brassinosteroid-related acyltransferase 1 [Selaginella moellendorffii]